VQPECGLNFTPVWDPKHNKEDLRKTLHGIAQRACSADVIDGEAEHIVVTRFDCPVLSILRSPVAQVAMIKLKESVTAARDSMDHAMNQMMALPLEGYHGRALSAIAPGETGFYLGGWDSEEVSLFSRNSR